MTKILTLFTLVTLALLPAAALALDVGDKAPTFEAPSTEGMVRLEAFQGEKNVVLALYYAAFTPV